MNLMLVKFHPKDMYFIVNTGGYSYEQWELDDEWDNAVSYAMEVIRRSNSFDEDDIENEDNYSAKEIDMETLFKFINLKEWNSYLDGEVIVFKREEMKE